MGAFHWTSKGVIFTISLEATGVQQHWDAMFLNIFLYAIFCCVMFIPVEFGIGRFLSGQTHMSNIEFTALSTKSFDPRVLSLEDLVQTLYVSHTSYHVRTSQLKASPPQYEELGVVSDYDL